MQKKHLVEGNYTVAYRLLEASVREFYKINTEDSRFILIQLAAIMDDIRHIA